MQQDSIFKNVEILDPVSKKMKDQKGQTQSPDNVNLTAVYAKVLEKFDVLLSYKNPWFTREKIWAWEKSKGN